MSGRQRVHRLKTRLDATFSRAPSSASDVELQSDFAKYLCVLVSGYLENAIVELILDVTESRSAPEVAQYVSRSLNYWTSPNCEKISKLLGSFRAEWGTDAEAYLVDERRAAINSLVALRHRIAHGENVGTSMAQVREYYVVVQEVVEFVGDLIGAQ